MKNGIFCDVLRYAMRKYIIGFSCELDRDELKTGLIPRSMMSMIFICKVSFILFFEQWVRLKLTEFWKASSQNFNSKNNWLKIIYNQLPSNEWIAFISSQVLRDDVTKELDTATRKSRNLCPPRSNEFQENPFD